jgi:hypothetical protein
MTVVWVGVTPFLPEIGKTFWMTVAAQSFPGSSALQLKLKPLLVAVVCAKAGTATRLNNKISIAVQKRSMTSSQD